MENKRWCSRRRALLCDMHLSLSEGATYLLSQTPVIYANEPK